MANNFVDWVACEHCGTWAHCSCVSISDNAEFYCDDFLNKYFFISCLVEICFINLLITSPILSCQGHGLLQYQVNLFLHHHHCSSGQSNWHSCVQNELEQLCFFHVPIILVVKSHPLVIGSWFDAGEAYQLVSMTLLNRSDYYLTLNRQSFISSL